MWTGIIIGALVVFGLVVYIEIRHSYFARKATAATVEVKGIATTAATIAQAAKAAVEKIKTGI